MFPPPSVGGPGVVHCPSLFVVYDNLYVCFTVCLHDIPVTFICVTTWAVKRVDYLILSLMNSTILL